ncbi:hypothetical protein ACFOPX_04095 [Helicobacter baculiformis]|uniref:Uncharacterized protein n=2 Tax=Helicobacter baculiformis TaxID=427351 RepID=A0ABV7ZGP5_9HELI
MIELLMGLFIVCLLGLLLLGGLVSVFPVVFDLLIESAVFLIIALVIAFAIALVVAVLVFFANIAVVLLGLALVGAVVVLVLRAFGIKFRS